MQNKECAEEISGLKTCIRIANQKIKLDEEFEVDLIFRNTSKHPIRIYLIDNDFFRSFQSYFYLLDNGKHKFLTEISPPHGYVVTEKDFHLIEPNCEIHFEQTLSIASAGIETKLHKAHLKWIYENKISKWEGGIQTLDGPTKKIFNGKKIPHIWRGKVDVTIEIEIIK